MYHLHTLKQVAAGLGVTALLGAGLAASVSKFRDIADEEEESLYGAKIQVDATEVRYQFQYCVSTSQHTLPH